MFLFMTEATLKSFNTYRQIHQNGVFKAFLMTYMYTYILVEIFLVFSRGLQISHLREINETVRVGREFMIELNGRVTL